MTCECLPLCLHMAVKDENINKLQVDGYYEWMHVAIDLTLV